MQTQIKVYTLGKFAIERDGQVLESFLSAKTALLFLYLAMHPGEHPREKLAAFLWSETDDEQSLKNLRTVLSSLRRQLEDVLVIARKSLAIRGDASVWVDAAVFESACADGFSLPGTLDPLKQMQGLAALYQGDFLASVKVRDAADLDDWLSARQQRLRQLYTQLLAGIVERSLEQANYTLGLQYAWTLATLDPFWEAARRQLMTLLAYSDRVNDALVQYDQLVRFLADELDARPEPETTRLYEQIKAGHARVPARTSRRTLSSPDMLFVEPADEVEFAQRMLNAPQCRLLTLFGISGIGKTALASQIAFHRQHRYRDGAYFISLSQAQLANSLPSLIARAAGIDLAGNTDAPTIHEIVIDYLKDRELLLVLDNYEHLLPDTGFVERLLDEAPRLQMIVASQNPLNLYREWLLPLKGLRVPETTTEQPETYEAVRLFELTAQRLNPRFKLADVIHGVIRICHLVDGLPLGIILAAGWTQVLPVNRIVEYIAEGMEFDLSYQRTLPDRHQSIETVLEYTWNTLDASQQRALIALSVFEGAFGIDTFTRLCGAGMDVLTSLIQKTLILKFDETYRIHQLVRRYARRKLFYSPEKEALSRNYLDYYRQHLKAFQRRALPIHEYLMAIETDYVNIWNYEWMPKSFQPIYTLSISRFLIAYWEIHQGHDNQQVLQLFDQISLDDVPLDTEWLALLHLQLARLLMQTDQAGLAWDHLLNALQYACATDSWLDQSLMFDLYASVADRVASAQHQPPSETDGVILQTAYRALARLYLDMYDDDLADDLFAQIIQHPLSPLDTALVLAARGAIAAANQAYANAYEFYEAALRQIQNDDQPLLALILSGSLMRLASVLNRSIDLCQHLSMAVTLAVQRESVPALVNLLAFCTGLHGGSKNAELNRDVGKAICSLSVEIKTNLYVATFLIEHSDRFQDCNDNVAEL